MKINGGQIITIWWWKIMEKWWYLFKKYVKMLKSKIFYLLKFRLTWPIEQVRTKPTINLTYRKSKNLAYYT